MKTETAAGRLYEEIEIRKKKGPFLAAIDGRCGAGKTTLASYFGEKFGWSVLHMDHFFLRPEQRTKERLERPGGNVDYERFLEEALIPLKRGAEEISYRPFDCRRQKLAEPVSIRTDGICLVEGSYSCHPALWDYYDLRVFLSIDTEEQMRRILRRNGKEAAQMFRERWIPLEERYFAAYRIKERCALYLEMG